MQQKGGLFIFALAFSILFLSPIVLADSDLVLFYEFNESIGSTQFNDTSMFNNTGYCSNTECPTLGLPGVFRDSANFDGLNDRITVPRNESLEISGEAGAVFSWVRLNSTIYLGQDVEITLLRRQAHSNPQAAGNYRLSIRRGNPNGPATVEIELGSHNDVQEVRGTTHVYGDIWHLIGFSYNETDILVYKDGVLETKAPKNKNITYTNPRPLLIGYDDRSKIEYFNGRLDEIKIFNRTVSESEVSQWYNSVINAPAVCGDGIHQTGEICEDGNNRDGDGCSSTCQREEDISKCIENARTGKLMAHFQNHNSDKIVIWSMLNITSYLGTAIYEHLDSNTTRLVNSSIIEIKPFGDLHYYLPIPDCKHTSVLYCGSTPILNLSKESYGNRLVDIGSDGSGFCEETQICGDGILQDGEECEPSLSDNCSQECKIICVDSDDDGVCDPDDFCPYSMPGEPVDDDGCDIFQFCEVFSCGNDCLYADWRNNELDVENPNDCTIAIRHQNGLVDRPVCVPTQFSNMCAS